MIAEKVEKEVPHHKQGLSKFVLLAGGIASSALLLLTMWGLQDSVTTQQPANFAEEFLTEIQPVDIEESSENITGRALKSSLSRK